MTVLIVNLTQPRNILEEGLNEELSVSSLSVWGGDCLDCLKWRSKANLKVDSTIPRFGALDCVTVEKAGCALSPHVFSVLDCGRDVSSC